MKRTIFCLRSLPTFLQTMKHNQKYVHVNMSKPAAFKYKIVNNLNFNHNNCICLRKQMLYSHHTYCTENMTMVFLTVTFRPIYKMTEGTISYNPRTAHYFFPLFPVRNSVPWWERAVSLPGGKSSS
jgi:hypothetical protein